MLIATAMGMCLMNGYEIVKGQSHSPQRRGTGEVENIPSPVSPFKGQK